MKFKRNIELEHGLRQIDIAPLIDIVFQLLIFFMLTSSFILQPGIKVNLPRAVSSEVIEDKNIVIAISSENVVYVNNSVFTDRELRSYLSKGGNALKSILITADKRASLGRVVEIWDLCREIGIGQVNIATNQE